MSPFDEEFATLDLLLQSDAETRGVDAFCLAWVKFERQLRKLTANTIYQASVFGDGNPNGKELSDALSEKKTSNYERFLGAIRLLSGEDLRAHTRDIAAERYRYLWRSIDVARQRRNKILHGLQTGESLARDALIQQVQDIKEVCLLLSNVGERRLGYDGVSRDSLRKNRRPEITVAVDRAISEAGWKHFVTHRI